MLVEVIFDGYSFLILRHDIDFFPTDSAYFSKVFCIHYFTPHFLRLN